MAFTADGDADRDAEAREAAERLARIEARRERLHVAGLGSSDHERRRVDGLIDRDRADARAERKRSEALARVAHGDPASLADAAIPPTPEMMAKGEFQPYAAKQRWTEETVPTVRRVSTLRIVLLHRRGVLDDDMFAACNWYRSRWERSGLIITSGVSQWGEGIRGIHEYGLIARSEIEAENRRDFRWAREAVPGDLVEMFDLVVLDERTLADAARAARCRYANAQAAFKRAALVLFGAISHLLPVR